jgi:flagellum-specific ATP synthase
MFAHTLLENTERLASIRVYGKVLSVLGIKIRVIGLGSYVHIGTICAIQTKDRTWVRAEVSALDNGTATLLPFGNVDRILLGARVKILENAQFIYPNESWLGRVINAFSEPIDAKGPLFYGDIPLSILQTPPNSHRRKRVQEVINLGVKAINLFTPVCSGQRMGIFAGSGVGKSVLLSMMAKFSTADVIVIGLIGERGREVQEFLQEYLGEEGLKKSIVVVSTSDEPALSRRQATYVTMTLAEYFRNQGQEVLCLIDSVTRFAMAQREIGLATGEPPTTKGYTPSVFTELQKLLERAGPGLDHHGNITGIFSVLVEGSDFEEPIADAVRGILDGHIILDRKIAERALFPAINIPKSLSRTSMQAYSQEQNAIVQQARRYISTFDDMEELIRIGAYRKGSDPEVDRSIALKDALDNLVRQTPNEETNIELSFFQLEQILSK